MISCLSHKSLKWILIKNYVAVMIVQVNQMEKGNMCVLKHGTDIKKDRFIQRTRR